jgi:hypothetical protein
MKNNFLSIITLLAFMSMVLGCTKDNFDPPASKLTGRVVYQNQPIGVRSNGVQLEIWQRGFQLFTKIPVFVAFDGSFSASLFDGNYKLVRLKGNGPWADATDSIDVKVSGNTIMDVPVDPYFIIKTSTFVKSGSVITGTITLQRVNTTKTLESVRIYLGSTLLVDPTNNTASTTVAAAAITDITAPLTINVTIPAPNSLNATRDYIYARVGVKTTGVSELAYGTPQQISLK